VYCTVDSSQEDKAVLLLSMWLRCRSLQLVTTAFSDSHRRKTLQVSIIIRISVVNDAVYRKFGDICGMRCFSQFYFIF